MPNQGGEDLTSASATRSYDALWERVDNQGRSIRALAEETSAQFRDFRADTARSQSELGAAIKAIDTKLDANTKSSAEASRPQYLSLFGAVIGAIGVAVSISQWQASLRDTPINDKIAAQGVEIAELVKGLQSGFTEAGRTYVTAKEFQQLTDFQRQLGDVKSQNAEQRRVLFQAQVDKVQEGMVPRAEHQFHWDGQQAFEQRMGIELASVNRRLDELAPASDTIKRLTDREHELELRVFGGKAPPPLSP